MSGSRILSITWFFLFFASGLSCNTPEGHGLAAKLLPKRGLHATFDGVPIVRGSSLKFASTDQNRNYYDFSWVFQPLKPGSQSTELLLGGPKSFVNGIYRMQTQGNTLKFQVEGTWQRADSAFLTIQCARIWLPAFADGKVFFDGENEPAVRLDAEGFPVSEVRSRKVKSIRIQGKYASISIQFSAKEGIARFASRVTDPAKRWDSAPPLLDISLAGMQLAPGMNFDKAFSMTFTQQEKKQKTPSEILELAAIPTDTAREVPRDFFPLLPAPKWSRLEAHKMVVLQAAPRLPNTLFEALFAEAIRRLWQVPNTGYENIIAQASPGTLPAEGFYISTGSGKIRVGYADTAGMRHAANALAFLARPVNGKLGIPEGMVNDYPSTSWRGIHMFVGPEATDFHRQMYEKVLLPWRMNKVVLQCEQTDWATQAKIKNPITMPLADLVAEASWLRERQIELIPLVQSFGHMEWFFENGQNLDLATNPEIPYTLDIENPRAHEALSAIWKEVAEATGAKTLHFGLDEVDMIGWAKKDPERLTVLWEKHLDFLSKIAESHGAKMMLWGDMLLAPEETIDFGNAETAAQAKKRRDAVPRGALIADWHYKAEADPAPYAPSLEALQASGLVPIASTWFFPENIRGFNHAAIQRKLGTLQTTWADFESSEANMLKYFPQFGVYLLSLDYAWSGRKELPEDLPYDANALWARFFYGHPEPIRPVSGYFISEKAGKPISCGPYKFLQLPNAYERETMVAHFRNPVKVSGAALLLENSSWADENETLGYITFSFKNGSLTRIPLRYGVHLRVDSDTRPVLAGYRNAEGQTAIYLPLDEPGELEKVEFTPANPCGTTRITGLTLL